MTFVQDYECSAKVSCLAHANKWKIIDKFIMRKKARLNQLDSCLVRVCMTTFIITVMDYLSYVRRTFSSPCTTWTSPRRQFKLVTVQAPRSSPHDVLPWVRTTVLLQPFWPRSPQEPLGCSCTEKYKSIKLSLSRQHKLKVLVKWVNKHGTTSYDRSFSSFIARK